MAAAVSVSAVIPCFNCAITLARAVESVDQQTARPVELILVDDASTDHTLAMCRELSEQYPKGWIKIIALPTNMGAADARNAGWDAARGEFVAFLDSDDCWHPDKLRCQYGFMEKNPLVDVSGHDFAYGNRQQQSAHRPGIKSAEAKTLFPWQVVLKNPFVTPSIMVKRRIQLRFDPGVRHMEDHLLLMRLALYGYKLAHLPYPLAYVFKPAYGHSGLSADMQAMHAAEISNLRKLLDEGLIPRIVGPLLQAYLFMKFLRRRMVVALRR